jgi:pimeloyl-ACP methyl ester carboxylesterase
MAMKRAMIDGIELAYEVRGDGTPIVFIHNGAGANWFKVLVDDPSLNERFQMVTYHRAGYGESSLLPATLSFAAEGERAYALMRHLGIARAHIVGHSSSACMALQFALDAPDAVQSLVLLEPPLMAVPSDPRVPRAIELFRTGDKDAAVDTFLQGTCGPDYRPALERAVPDAFDQALAGADTFFTQELPALRQWQFGPDDARRISQPVLAVRGERSGPIHQQRWDLLVSWLPYVEPFVLPDASHLLHLENPQGMAEQMAAFIARQPLPTAS